LRAAAPLQASSSMYIRRQPATAFVKQVGLFPHRLLGARRQSLLLGARKLDYPQHDVQSLPSGCLRSKPSRHTWAQAFNDPEDHTASHSLLSRFSGERNCRKRGLVASAQTLGAAQCIIDAEIPALDQKLDMSKQRPATRKLDGLKRSLAGAPTSVSK
jgi:hypothetical protein